MPILPEDRRTRVTPLDRAVEIVPVVQEANRRVWLVAHVERINRLVERDLAEQRERAVQHAAVVRAGDDDMSVPVVVNSLENVPIVRQIRQLAEGRYNILQLADGSQDNRIGIGQR